LKLSTRGEVLLQLFAEENIDQYREGELSNKEILGKIGVRNAEERADIVRYRNPKKKEPSLLRNND